MPNSHYTLNNKINVSLLQSSLTKTDLMSIPSLQTACPWLLEHHSSPPDT